MRESAGSLAFWGRVSEAKVWDPHPGGTLRGTDLVTHPVRSAPLWGPPLRPNWWSGPVCIGFRRKIHRGHEIAVSWRSNLMSVAEDELDSVLPLWP